MMIVLQILGVVIALMVPTVAIAAAPAPTPAVRAACGADARKFCNAVIRDPGARHKCMVEHSAQLSEACKAAIAQNRQTPAGAATSPENAAPPEANAPPVTSAPPSTNAPDTK
jgi:hypothetical protein